MDIQINLPDNVLLILDRLKKYGSIGYVVGGCIRDIFLGREPNDYDICTGLLPEVVEKVFQDFHVIETGIKHGTVAVVIEDVPYEITTFRIDGTYSDGRHPDNVNFTERLEDDLKRRDFTINAMAYNPDVGLIDMFNGISDLENGIIRCVGNPLDRFDEDGLRILRALRFAITLNFNIENKTMDCIKKCKYLLDRVSRERICSEVQKMMQTKFPHSFDILRNCMDTLYCLDSYFDDNMHCCDYNSIIDSLISTDTNDDWITRFALLLQYIENPKTVLSNIKLDNVNTKSILHILINKDRYNALPSEDNERKYFVRKLISEIGYKDVKRLFNFWKSRIYVATPIKKFYFLKTIDNANNDLEIIILNNDCCCLEKLDINGDDLIQIGYEPSEEIGCVLNLLLDEVMHDPYKNKKNWLIKWAEDLFNINNTR